MSVRVRFAPSPTGYLHVGGARTALFNWLYARHHGGTMILRIEDTDASRNTPEANEAIFSGLRWLGIDWDEGPEAGGDFGPYRQSERREVYDRYFAKLEDAGLVYEDDGAMRFRAPNNDVTVDDLICGATAFRDRSEPDMTIRRPDGSYVFHFVSVVDDIEMGMTHVIRGEDHLSNTPRHLDLYAAFGVTPPAFAHIPLILNSDGSKMAKRDRGASVAEYANTGFVPEAVCNFLVLLGWSPGSDEEILAIEEIVRRFDLAGVNKSNARFDFKKCRWMNQQYIGAMASGAFLEKARAFSNFDAADEAFLLAQPRIETFAEVDDILSPILDPGMAVDEAAAARVAANAPNREILPVLAENLERAEWTEEGIAAALGATAGKFECKPGKIMFPLRVSATGAAHGADLVPSLLLIGREETARRIRERTDTIFKA